MKIYHNPRCRKSRETLQLIRDAGVEPEIVEYLKTPLDAAALKGLLQKLGMEPEALIRKGEKVFKEQYKGKNLSAAEWIKAMAENPVLMERPVVEKGAKAIVGRPPENVQALL